MLTQNELDTETKKKTDHHMQQKFCVVNECNIFKFEKEQFNVHNSEASFSWNVSE